MSWSISFLNLLMKSIMMSRLSWIALLFLLTRIGFEFYFSPSSSPAPPRKNTNTNTPTQQTVQETNDQAATAFLSNALNKASIHRCKKPTDYQPSNTNTTTSWTEQCDKDWGWRLFSDWMSNQKIVIDGHSKVQCAINPRTFSFCKYTNVTIDYGKAQVTGLTRTFDTGFFATYGRCWHTRTFYSKHDSCALLTIHLPLLLHIHSTNYYYTYTRLSLLDLI